MLCDKKNRQIEFRSALNPSGVSYACCHMRCECFVAVLEDLCTGVHFKNNNDCSMLTWTLLMFGYLHVSLEKNYNFNIMCCQGNKILRTSGEHMSLLWYSCGSDSFIMYNVGIFEKAMCDLLCLSHAHHAEMVKNV